MIHRTIRGQWRFQAVINRTVIERLSRDTEAVQRFGEKLASNPMAREIAGLPRYLAAAEALDTGRRERCRALLQAEAHDARPRASDDAVDDATQAVSHRCLEVLAPFFPRHYGTASTLRGRGPKAIHRNLYRGWTFIFAARGDRMLTWLPHQTPPGNAAGSAAGSRRAP
jgi:hypothetical protein